MTTQKNHMIVNQSTLMDAEIAISGYRHASNLLLSVAVILPECHFKFINMPNLLDTEVMLRLLKELGASFSYQDNMLEINTKDMSLFDVSKELSKEIHGSIYLIPALLARFGEVSFGQSGGCQIGSETNSFKRPADHIYSTLIKFGADVIDHEDSITAKIRDLHSTEIDINEFSYDRNTVVGPLTSGATKTAILMALAVKDGNTTTIHNPFLKSETIDLLDLIKECGYKVECNEQKLAITYQKINEKINHHVISDPSEIITYSVLAGYHDIELTLTHITLDRTWEIIQPEVKLLKRMGLNFTISEDSLIVKKVCPISAQQVEITVKEVCTDHHPFIAALLLKADANSLIKELVWLERFQYIPELAKFGIKTERKENCITIYPGEAKSSNEVITCPDLRAAAMLLIIALSAPGLTYIQDFEHLNRGYVHFVRNLISMGAQISFTSN